MRYMVVEFSVIPQNGVVGVVELQQMLQRSGGLFLGGVDLMDCDRWKV